MATEAAAWPLVSVCIPVRNGADRLGRCLQALSALDYPPDRLEIIVADGMSTDATADVARAHGATVLVNPKQIVASGRNIAFAAARGEFIASTDDDCIVPQGWLKTALAAFADPNVGAVGGVSYLPETARPWARAANYVFRVAGRAGYSVQSDHLPGGDAVDLPGCNALYRTEVCRTVGPFDEELVTAEDVDFHQRIRDCGMSLSVHPELYVWHDKRSTPAGLFRQMRRFAEGRVQLDRTRPGALRPVHRLLGWAWAYAPPLLVGLLAWLPLWLPPAVLAGVCAAVAGKAVHDGETMATGVLAGPALVVMLAAWSVGYLKESLVPMPSAAGR